MLPNNERRPGSRPFGFRHRASPAPTERDPMLQLRSQRRRGAVLVESAVVFPVFMILLLGLIVGGMGIFRYQQVAWLAREGARYASVRGADYKKEVSGATAATAQTIRDNAI